MILGGHTPDPAGWNRIQELEEQVRVLREDRDRWQREAEKFHHELVNIRADLTPLQEVIPA